MAKKVNPRQDDDGVEALEVLLKVVVSHRAPSFFVKVLVLMASVGLMDKFKIVLYDRYSGIKDSLQSLQASQRFLIWFVKSSVILLCIMMIVLIAVVWIRM
ncbi:MAG: hypothetical protein OXF06_10805 [Bacteroidetes bacterium]|nr:hypothetical protein [Bacteroidota bacterium]